jgi:8-oxo-dGTP pyrophosphatase MutT (NUDIX family)
MLHLPERFQHHRGVMQYAALPYRTDNEGGIEILLVTSRATGRWIIPKGWPADGLAPHLSAAKEAWEEAGVRGEAASQAIGSFRYRKSITGRRLTVAKFPLEVLEQLDRWPERLQRQRRWFAAGEAARVVTERPLGRIIGAFRPAGS